MRTRRSPRNQEILWRELAQQGAERPAPIVAPAPLADAEIEAMWWVSKTSRSLMKRDAAKARMKMARTRTNPAKVADEILRQLGGGRFIVMTGARFFVGSEDSLSFKLPRTTNGINAVRIVLTPDDLYTVEFLRVQGTKLTEVERVDGVYNDQLQRVFTDVTGLDTKL